MPLTPADIHNTAFKRPPIGKRGYDEEEVDAFLDEVEQELIRLLEENAVLQDQMRRGASGAGAGPASALTAEYAELTAQLERLQEARARAEQNARSVQAQLERARNAAQAGPIGSAADDDRNAGVLMMAQRTADDHMRDARRESEALLSNTRAKIDQITGEAQLKAGTIESDARNNHTEAMNTMGAKRAAVLDEIERLNQLARGYHAALSNHVTQQLRELNSAPDAPGGREIA